MRVPLRSRVPYFVSLTEGGGGRVMVVAKRGKRVTEEGEQARVRT